LRPEGFREFTVQNISRILHLVNCIAGNCIRLVLMETVSHRFSTWELFSRCGSFFNRLKNNWCSPLPRCWRSQRLSASQEVPRGVAPRERQKGPCKMMVEGFLEEGTPITASSGSLVPPVFLLGPGVYTCVDCQSHHLNSDAVISKAFQGRGGKAYLVEQVVNFWKGPTTERRLMTGLHLVADIYCAGCGTLFGWTYERAFDPSQKYKEGKFVVEKTKVYLNDS